MGMTEMKPRCALGSVLDEFDEVVRQEFALDGLACLLDGPETARRYVTGTHGLIVVLVALTECAARLAETGVDLGSLEDAHRVGWVGQAGHPRRTYLQRRFGAAAVERVESALRRDVASLKPIAALVLSQVAPFLSAIGFIYEASDLRDPAEWPDPDLSQTRQFVDLAASLAAEGSMSPASSPPDLVTWTPLARRLLEVRTPDLVRKFDGALFTLQSDNPDATSQAANSIIELLDRLVRTLAPSDQVLDWCLQQGDPALLRDDREEPAVTKRGQLLYVVEMVCGIAAAESERLRSGLVTVALRTRDAAQKLKHADRGDQDRPECARLLRATEAVLVVFNLTVTLENEMTPAVADYFESLEKRFSTFPALGGDCGGA